jgi:acyl-coenzyme A thioesterase PaaI-like protein
MWDGMEAEGAVPQDTIRLPKTIDFTVDYLRAGLPRDAYARARVNRSGRRYASVHVEAWQDNRSRLFAQATGHFLMPTQAGG